MIKEYDELTESVRQDFNYYIRNNYIGESCEICGIAKNLELHHKIPLSKVVKGIILKNIPTDIRRSLAIGLQIENGFNTLCKDCHIELHNSDSNLQSRGVRDFIRKQKYEESRRELESYLDSIVGKRLYVKSKEREEFIKKVGLVRKENNTLIKNCRDIRVHLEEEFDNKYSIMNKVCYKKETYRKKYWKVFKIK